MTITIGNIEIEVQRKRIKNIHLHVKPDNRVFITAPLHTSLSVIKKIAEDNINWINKSLEKYKEMPKKPESRLETGEKLYVFGNEYTLMLVPGNGSSFYLSEDKAVLIMKPDSSIEERRRAVDNAMRELLSDKVSQLFPKWEKITGLKANEWHIKSMKTRWGSCNPSAKRIWLSLQLAEKPEICIEYVILHELVHFWFSNHGSDFKARMDEFMPDWREIRVKLNNR